ncbi:MAG: sensor histidine kinase [Planctomycetota bacterium]|jgi:signal transduction histidine kinase
MEPVPENIRLLRGAYWLTKLRWIAIVYVVLGAYISSNILAINLHEIALYIIATLLTMYNITVLVLLNHLKRADQQVSCKAVKKIINLQICADLFLLTVLLHFSGGIENPLVFYFVFHMIIASILLSTRESYLQATFAVFLLVLLVLLEYKQLISHYCLTGFVPYCLHKDKFYTVGTLFIFITALYLAVYMANYIAIRLKHTEHAYRQANIMLQEKDRIKDEYVLRVTHDIKGHLATIQGCLAILANRLLGKIDGQEADLINRAHIRTVKLTNFVKALLTLTQMRLSNRLEMDAFSLSDALQNAISSVKPKAEGKSITLNCTIEPSVDRIFGDRFSIEEMVTNLLLNAIKYTNEKGTIEMNAGNHEDFVKVEITDTGIGIPQQEQSEIFEEFYRATNAKEVERDGTGLGLSIVKHIIERHNGSIWVDSREGIGTKFSFTLPKITVSNKDFK